MNHDVGQETTPVDTEMAHLVATLLANLERDGQTTDAITPSQEPPLGDILRTLVQHIDQVMQ